MPTSSPSQPTQQTGFSGTQVKAMALKPGDACTASTTQRRPGGAWRLFQNPPRCQRVEDLGAALEDWLSKKRQNEMFKDLFDRLLASSSTTVGQHERVQKAS